MSAYVNMGDKVIAGTSSSGAITLNNQQNIFTSDAIIGTAGKAFTITSQLIDAYTIPVVTVMQGTAETGAKCTVTYGILTPTSETLTNGAQASITKGTFTFTLTCVGTASSVAPQIGVCFL